MRRISRALVGSSARLRWRVGQPSRGGGAPRVRSVIMATAGHGLTRSTRRQCGRRWPAHWSRNSSRWTNKAGASRIATSA